MKLAIWAHKNYQQHDWLNQASIDSDEHNPYAPKILFHHEASVPNNPIAQLPHSQRYTRTKERGSVRWIDLENRTLIKRHRLVKSLSSWRISIAQCLWSCNTTQAWISNRWLCSTHESLHARHRCDWPAMHFLRVQEVKLWKSAALMPSA